MRFHTKVIIWLAMAQVCALILLANFSKEKKPHAYKTENIQGLLYTPEKIDTTIRLLSPSEIAFANLEAPHTRNLLKELGAYPEIEKKALIADPVTQTPPDAIVKAENAVPASNPPVANETLPLNAPAQNDTLPIIASAGNDTLPLNTSAETEPVPANKPSENETLPSNTNTEPEIPSLNVGTENQPSDSSTTNENQPSNLDPQTPENEPIPSNLGVENEPAISNSGVENEPATSNQGIVSEPLASNTNPENDPLPSTTVENTPQLSNVGVESEPLASSTSPEKEPSPSNTAIESEPTASNAVTVNEPTTSNSNVEKEPVASNAGPEIISDAGTVNEPVISNIVEQEPIASIVNTVSEPVPNNPEPQIIQEEEDYCHKVDNYNLENLGNMFQEKTFFTDFPKGYIRRYVLNEIGKVRLGNKKSLDKRITTFFTNSTKYHTQHEIGKDFLCTTQMYNHIPGSEPLTKKDSSLDLYRSYVTRYNGNQLCLDTLPAVPKSFRLHVKEECVEFFDLVNSEEYEKTSETIPLQYLIKPGNDSHRSQGIELFTKEMRSRMNEIYDAGEHCGYWQKSLIAQAYISNPMLLNLRNKFDFKVYMLVASTNPLIVYYHDGYLRASLSEYNKSDLDRGVHITNTQANEEKFIQTMQRLAGFATIEEIKGQQLLNFDDFENMLIDMGRIQAKGWLSSYLRPALQKAIIHLVRMSKDIFSKQNNVYQLFGLDFLIDDNMKVWYLEANDNVHYRFDTDKIGSLTLNLLRDMFEIQYAYYRGRMKRLVNMIWFIEKEIKDKGYVDYNKWRGDYKDAAVNKLDPEYKIGEENSFKLIMDENLKGVDAYQGLLPKECI